MALAVRVDPSLHDRIGQIEAVVHDRRMSRLYQPVGLVALALIGCCSRDDHRSNLDCGPNAPQSAPGPSKAIAGQLTVHFGDAFGDPSKFVVMIDDGSRFTGHPDRNGDLVFTDPSLQGPQTITWLRAAYSMTGVRLRDESAVTWVDVAEADVWLGGMRPDVRQSLPRPGGFEECMVYDASRPPPRTIRGFVTGSSGGPTDVYAIFPQDGISASPSPQPTGRDGAFTISHHVCGSGRFAVVALERAAASLGTTNNSPRRVGVVGDVALAETVDVKVKLEHAVDQTLSVAVKEPGPWNGALTVRTGVQEVFSTKSSGAGELSLPRTALEGSLAGMSESLSLSQSSDGTGPSSSIGCAIQKGTQRVSVRPLQPAVLLEPSAGHAQPRSTLMLRWTADPAADHVTITIHGADAFTWTILAPARKHEFRPPVIPLPAGEHKFSLQSSWSSPYALKFRGTPFERPTQSALTMSRGAFRLE
jgi:hypothetical protein